jgi:hypothetical protein
MMIKITNELVMVDSISYVPQKGKLRRMKSGLMRLQELNHA